MHESCQHALGMLCACRKHESCQYAIGMLCATPERWHALCYMRASMRVRCVENVRKSTIAERKKNMQANQTLASVLRKIQKPRRILEESNARKCLICLHIFLRHAWAIAMSLALCLRCANLQLSQRRDVNRKRKHEHQQQKRQG